MTSGTLNGQVASSQLSNGGQIYHTTNLENRINHTNGLMHRQQTMIDTDAFSLGLPNAASKKKKRRKVMDLVDRSKNVKLSYDDLVNFNLSRDHTTIGIMSSTSNNNNNNSNNNYTSSNTNSGQSHMTGNQQALQHNNSSKHQQIISMFNPALSIVAPESCISISSSSNVNTSNSTNNTNSSNINSSNSNTHNNSSSVNTFQSNYNDLSRRGLEIQQHPNGRYRLKPIQYKFDYKRNYTNSSFENIFNASESILIEKLDSQNRSERRRLAAIEAAATAASQPKKTDPTATPSITTLLKNSSSFSINTARNNNNNYNYNNGGLTRRASNLGESKALPQPSSHNQFQRESNYQDLHSGYDVINSMDMFDDTLMYTRVDSPMRLGKAAGDYEVSTFSTMNFNQRYNSQFEMFQSTKAPYMMSTETANATGIDANS
jgi:hypothetical protein